MRNRVFLSNTNRHLQDNASLYVFVIILFMMGVIFGAIVVNSLNFAQKQDLFYYLSQFFKDVASGNETNNAHIWTQSYIDNMKYVALIAVLGISVIGLPLILILLFLKGMVVGFTVGFLVNQMGWSGFLLASGSMMPQNLIVVPCFIIMGMSAMAFSIRLIRKQFSRRGEAMMPIIKQYMFVVGCIAVLFILAASIEAYISPYLLKQVIVHFPVKEF